MQDFNAVARPLNTQENVRDFFINVLSFKDDEIKVASWKRTMGRICDNEISNLQHKKNLKSTLFSQENRLADWSEEDRWKLRKKIVTQLFEEQRLSDDDDITIKKGGSKPQSVKRENIACIIIGPPAAGKSGIANKIADKLGAYILDNDYAKRKFPEYKDKVSGASLLHQEAGAMIFPNSKIQNRPEDFNTLFELCAKKKINIVVPKIGHLYTDIYELFLGLKEKGYTVHLVGVSLDRKLATKRALERMKKTKRYVPLSLIFDAYGNDPILTYYRLKRMYRTDFESFGKVSTDVPIDGKNKFEKIEFDEKSPIKLISQK